MKKLASSTEEETKEGKLGDEDDKEETDGEYKLYKNFWGIQKYLNNPC